MKGDCVHVTGQHVTCSIMNDNMTFKPISDPIDPTISLSLRYCYLHAVIVLGQINIQLTISQIFLMLIINSTESTILVHHHCYKLCYAELCDL